jgi:outer membrane protein assembly factor BamB
VLTASPVIASGVVYVAVTDLGDGTTGGIVALDLATGAQRWRVPTTRTIRGGLAIADGTLLAPLIDGTLLGLDATTGALRWRLELSSEISPEAGALFAAPTADQDDLFVGHQRTVAAIGARAGSMLWTDDPVPDGRDSQSAAAIAIGDGIAVGTFERALGGVIAWDRVTGQRLWQVNAAATIAINASPVIDHDTVYFSSGADEVTALDLAGHPRWNVKLDPDGFEWGNATIGTPALSREILVVPTLYRDLVALDARTGAELWRASASPGPLRTTHYRGGHEAGFAASPVITGDLVWAVDTSGQLFALELRTGRQLWRTELGVPVLAPLAASGDYLVVASYDGTVRALAPGEERVVRAAPACDAVPLDPPGCCSTRRSPASVFMLALIVAVALRRRRATSAAR